MQQIFIHKLIEHRAEENPDKLAVVFCDERITYSELNLQSDRIAQYLVKSGIKPESDVGICLKPGLGLVSAILGIMKSGGVYIPVSPDYPKARIEYILKDSEAAIIIAENGMNFESAKTIGLDDFLTKGADSEHLPDVEIQAYNAAYILYTSGSTGKPKGVIVEHRNLAYYLNWYLSELQPEAGIELPLSSSMSFAAGVTQFFAPLLQGKTLHILPPETVRQPDKLLQWYAEHPGFGLYCVPTLWEELVSFAEKHKTEIPHPEGIFLSGEAVSDSLIDKSSRRWADIKIWNLYGPTEAVANLSFTRLMPGKQITLGKPLGGTKLLVLDEDLKPADSGELYASGGGIARGYQNLPELTERTFIKHIPGISDDARYYKTGDSVKIDQNGNLFFSGRIDSQVKIRGYRIEPGEIESVLSSCPTVRQAVVAVDNDSSFGKRLIAYIVCDERERLP
ncbi:MAG: hypothetical protein QG635_1174, partial [Bacteroidota bacterium]|nr:hypothetical protein [Bacteroidota bacterium]